jgi:hypothetical protein
VRFAQEPSSVGLTGLTLSWSARVDAWASLATRKRAEAAAAAESVAQGAYASGDTCTQGVW